jgi:hypothetical protein
MPGLKSLSGIHTGGMAKMALEDLKVVRSIHRKGKMVMNAKTRRVRYMSVHLPAVFWRLDITISLLHYAW